MKCTPRQSIVNILSSASYWWAKWQRVRYFTKCVLVLCLCVGGKHTNQVYLVSVYRVSVRASGNETKNCDVWGLDDCVRCVDTTILHIDVSV